MDKKWLHEWAPLAVADSSTWGDGTTVVVRLTPDHLLQAAQALKDRGFFLEFMTALDVQEGFLLTYLFSTWRGQDRLVLRVSLDHESPEAPSLVSIHPGADWHERECRDFFGITFSGHPHLEPLLLPVEMETHPLLKTEAARKSVSDLFPAKQTTPASEEVRHKTVKTITQAATS